MEAWRLWWKMACESEAAARQAEANGHLRSSASRYYYATYQAATALLLYRGMIPQVGREAWNHVDTPALLQDQLPLLIRSKFRRDDLAQRLVDLYRIRIVADYVGREIIGKSRIQRAGKDARYILQIAGALLPERRER
jgi:hypothetical protein